MKIVLEHVLKRIVKVGIYAADNSARNVFGTYTRILEHIDKVKTVFVARLIYGRRKSKTSYRSIPVENTYFSISVTHVQNDNHIISFSQKYA